jgi:capsular exopolysaccharide synthesis family protein
MNANRLPSYSVTELDAYQTSGQPAPGPHQDESPFVVFQRLHRLLRGRYAIAVTLAAMGAVGGAVAGWKSSHPRYRSEGALRVAASIPKKLYDTESNQALPNFTGYVRSVANLLQEPRVIDWAMNSDEWKKLGRGLTPAERDAFVDSLQVVTDREDPEWIRVRFTDADKTAAKVAVEQVIEAFERKHGKDLNLVTPGVIAEVQTLWKQRERTVTDIRESINTLLMPFPTSDLNTLQTATYEQYAKADYERNQLDDQIRRSEAVSSAESEDAAAPAAEADPLLIAGQIAAFDPTVQSSYQRRQMAFANFEDLKARGLLQKSPWYISAQNALTAADAELSDTVNRYLLAHNGVVPSAGATDTFQALPKESLVAAKQRLSYLEERVSKLGEDLKAISEAKSKLEAKQDELKRAQDELARADQRLKELTVETSDGGNRITIYPPIDEPHRPSSDPRKKLAAFGFFFGGGAPIALVMLLGLLDGRFRYSDDAGSGKKPVTLLGILPYLPEQLHDPEQASVAAHCVHQIRTLLQISGKAHDRKVFAITSPTAGDGKTSLSLSLGLSFAASGANTCLIDFDMIGGGLTSAMQAKTDNGLMDAFDHGTLNGFVRPTSFPRLSIVPIGRDDSQDVNRLSPDVVKRVINEARERFDVVVVDTGPILGSIEASLAAASADGVILALGRGQQRFQAERAMDYLAGVGANLLGIVFNRAQPSDFRRAVSSASVRSVPARDAGNAEGDGVRALPAFGPMARTVASAIQPQKDQKE